MNLNNKLVPSPRSRNARKPLIKLVGHQETLSLDRNKQEVNKNTFNYSLDRPKTKPIEEKPKDVQNNQHNLNAPRENNNAEKEFKQCINHQGRIAVSMVEKRTICYYCFECSLYQARKGSKVKQLSSTSQHNPQKRENEIKKYIEQAQQAQMSLSHHLNKLKQSIKTQVSQIESLIERQKCTTAQRIAKLKQDLTARIQALEKVKHEQIAIFQGHCKELGEMRNVIKCNRLDVVGNFQGCVFQFSTGEFNKIMDQYQAQVRFSKQLIKKTGIPILDTKLRQSELGSIDFAPSSSRQQFFTFSKNDHIYETPKTNSKFDGVPTISSSYGLLNKSNKQNLGKNVQNGDRIIINSFN